MATSLKDNVINVLDQLPQAQLAEVLDFALFVKSRAGDNLVQPAVTENAETPYGPIDHSVDVVEGAERLYYGRH